ncbi:hypothetical protein [Thermomonas sp.]|uniref:hypothetical protein n=1 Tax=Thermomonas sp. TaxID=1971895 RepID=UPI002488A694|nr:hypothetical protein [Thermomonas sp.]MDI1253036.1 hypothetical protein [Thermomonas sp.]
MTNPRLPRNFISRTHLYLALLATLALGATASAADNGDIFQQMDANKDGRISAQEHIKGAAANFARMDANKDGQLMGDEMMHMRRAMMDTHAMQGPGHQMTMMDANHDGEITAAEHAAGAAAMFARMDTNHDGRLKGDELNHGMGGMRGPDGHPGMGNAHGGQHVMMDMDDASKQAMHHDTDHDAMKPGGMAHDGMGYGGMGGMMDANHDGKITAKEHAAAASAMFARIDANHDGYVTRAEFDAGTKVMPGAH